MTEEERDNSIKVIRNFDLNNPKVNSLLFSPKEIANAFDRAVDALLKQQLYEDAVSNQAEPFVLTCDGCRHVGTYDADFPCSGCIRREKDYYEQER